MKMKMMFAAGLCLLLGACAIKQTIQPVTLAPSAEVCIVRNADVKTEFLAAIEDSVRKRGFSARRLEPGSSPNDCPTTIIYTANWSWDLAMYLSFARIDVYQAGARSGSAEYNARGGGGNMGKFISAEAKVDELVSGLLK